MQCDEDRDPDAQRGRDQRRNGVPEIAQNQMYVRPLSPTTAIAT
jgi:hypothetical protein